jgi:hypothetical protein
MQYIHRGVTAIINQMKEGYLQVKILQVIPKFKTNDNGKYTSK